MIDAARRISSSQFVGRAAELAALAEALQEAQAGRGRAIVVEGEAGIGKSRLMAELESRARAAGVVTLVGECMELAEGELPFVPMVSALRPVVEDPGVLARLEPPLRSAIGALWPTAGRREPGIASREQLFEAIYRLLARLAAETPVLLVLEDVHWIDPSSRDLLGFLVRQARRDRIVIVATCRYDELHRGHPLRQFVVELERSGRAERLELEGLERDDVAAQITAIVGRRPERAVLDVVYARCEGNPFFVEELLAGSSGEGGELPSSLRELLLLRIERLSAVTREVLGAAATIGRSVDHRLLSAVAAAPEPRLLEAVREAAEHHVLLAARGQAAYRFRHALLREAIYDDTLPGVRLRLHRVIAETLSARPELAGEHTSAAAELAHHWDAAGDMPAALAAAVQAANEAARMHAHPEALRHLQRALELWGAVPGAEDLVGADRTALLLRASEIAGHTGNDELSLQLALEGRRAATEAPDPLRAAAAEERVGCALWDCGRADDALEHLARVVRLVPERPPSAERAEALAGYGRFLMLNGSFGYACGFLEEAMELASATGAPATEASALNSLAIVYDQLGERQRAIAAGQEGLRIATELDDGAEMLRAYINFGQAIDNRGQPQQAVDLGLEGIAIAHTSGVDRAAGDQLRQQVAWRLIRLGRFGEAQDIIGPALESATLQFNIAAAKTVAGYLAAVRGAWTEAEFMLSQAWDLMQRTGSFQLIGLALAWRTSLHLWRGRLDQARQVARDGVARVVEAEGQLIYTAEFYWLATRVEAEIAARERTLGRQADATQATRAADAASAAFDDAIARHPGEGAPAEARAFAALARAELGRARDDRAIAPWLSAAECFMALGEPLPAAYAEMRVGEVLALEGGPRPAIAKPLQGAHATALALGVVPFRAEIEALARRARVDLPGPDEPDRAATDELGLTDREAEVLVLIAEGRTNRQIGQELFITGKTASAHVSRILMKLGVANRAEAAAAAHRLGLARRDVTH